MKLAEPFASKFEADKLLLFQTEHWSVLLRRAQVTLGSLILATNRQVLSAAELTDDELGEYRAVVGRMESALAQAFQNDKINYFCLMMFDNHYHFHVFPRYESGRSLAGREWTDDAWPWIPSLKVADTDDSVLAAIRAELSNHI